MAVEVRLLHHTGITVRDLERSISLWRDAFGFEEIRRFELAGDFIGTVTGVVGAELRAALMQGPGHIVELLEFTAPDSRERVDPRPCDVGAAHVALVVEDIDQVRRGSEPFGLRLAGGVALMTEGPLAGHRFAFLRDSDGLTVELIEVANGSTSTDGPGASSSA